MALETILELWVCRNKHHRRWICGLKGSPASDVYHELHCLKYIRHYIYRDSYPIIKTNVPSLDHIDHCIDSLRQLVMCRTDVAIQTYSWIPTLRIPWANFETEHECQNWDALDGWASQRAFDLYDPKMLRHPTLGNVAADPAFT